MTVKSKPKPQVGKWAAITAASSMGVAGVLAPFVMLWESGGAQHLVPYRDVAGVWTQCHGETLNVTATTPAETPAGCDLKLDKRLGGFAAGVARCTPAVRGRDYQWAALTSTAYNIGLDAYCGSTIDKRADAGNWRGACDAILMWDKARVRVRQGAKWISVMRPVQGLTNRRRAERELCMKGV